MFVKQTALNFVFPLIANDLNLPCAGHATYSRKCFKPTVTAAQFVMGIAGANWLVEIIYYVLINILFHTNMLILTEFQFFELNKNIQQFLIIKDNCWVRVKNLFPRLGRVSHLWFGFGFGKFPLKIPNFEFFSFRVKKYHRVGSKGTRVIDGLASHPLRAKSMLRSDRVSAHLY